VVVTAGETEPLEFVVGKPALALQTQETAPPEQVAVRIEELPPTIGLVEGARVHVGPATPCRVAVLLVTFSE
jgi:hypothetical protein